MATASGRASRVGATPNRALVDTNVWLDANLPFRPNSEEACRAIDAALGHGAQLLCTAAQLQDVFCIAGQTLKRRARLLAGGLSEAGAAAIGEIAWGIVDSVCELATVVGADQADVWLARRLRSVHPDLEDNLVIAAAERVHADCILTCDEQLIRRSPVAALDPPTFMSLLAATGEPA